MQQVVKFASKKAEYLLIAKIVQRAAGEMEIRDRVALAMDLDAVNSNDTKLDLEQLIGFNTFNFCHDISGIINCLDRNTGKLTRGFLPRCARKGGQA